MRFVNNHPVWSVVIVLGLVLAIVLVTQSTLLLEDSGRRGR